MRSAQSALSPHPEDAGGSRNPPPFRGPLVLLAASVLLIAAGAVLLVLPHGTRGTGAADNRALTDAAATRQVTAAVKADVAGIFSYDYTDLDATTSLARQVLTGQAAAQYARLSPMLGSAVSEKLIVSTKVTAIGVRSLTGDTATQGETATLLVFLDQNSVRDGKPAGHAAAQLQVTARLSAGHWLITEIGAD